MISAFNQNPPADLRAQILDSLGRFDFSTVAATCEQYLEARATPHELRVVAAEALANSSDDAVPLLLQLAGSDADPNVRASAAWSISAHDTVSDLGPTLAALAEREQAADVRRRLYEALLTQDTFPADRLLPVIQAETDIPTRVAGYNALGSAIRQDPGSAAATAFDDTFVPELVRIATSPNSLNLQMRAVFALRRAQTPAARNALAIIAENARPQVVSAARNGLSAAKANL